MISWGSFKALSSFKSVKPLWLTLSSLILFFPELHFSHHITIKYEFIARFQILAQEPKVAITNQNRIESASRVLAMYPEDV